MFDSLGHNPYLGRMTDSTIMPDLVGTAEAAGMLRLDRRTIHRKVEAGELEPVSKLPGLRGAYIFDRAVVEALKERKK